eukprot:COSAG05_NODE_2385_length_3135_cov_7.205863_3_plen_330_part_01
MDLRGVNHNGVGISVTKMNHSAQLSRKATMCHCIIMQAIRGTAELAANQLGMQKRILASPGLVPALLWASANDFSFPGISLAGYAGGAAASLIGRNEEGLTLTHEAIRAVLGNWMMFFNPSNRRSEYPAYRVIGDAMTLANITISDKNITLIVKHDGIFDCLVAALLLDPSNPRREHKGAAQLQTATARTLQNLALSPVGAGLMRAHSGVMVALRQLSGSAISEEAQQCASGALFELDESTRSAVDASNQRDTDAIMADHIMLSYNWDHQSVIKRVNSALQARGYAVWIDIEKMQGSTVEVMSAAVEDAAVMCYGISQAYKESANCRLEA